MLIFQSLEQGEDFVELNETVTLSNSSELCIQLNISNDVIFEANETFAISAQHINSSGVSVTTSSKITIIDDESKSKSSSKHDKKNSYLV